jgi:hypothetical protein
MRGGRNDASALPLSSGCPLGQNIHRKSLRHMAYHVRSSCRTTNGCAKGQKSSRHRASARRQFFMSRQGLLRGILPENASKTRHRSSHHGYSAQDRSRALPRLTDQRALYRNRVPALRRASSATSRGATPQASCSSRLPNRPDSTSMRS